MTNEDVADRRVDERVVDGKDGADREAEHDLGAFHLEALDEGLGSGEFHGDLFDRSAGSEHEKPLAERGAEQRTAREGGRALHNYDEGREPGHQKDAITAFLPSSQFSRSAVAPSVQSQRIARTPGPRARLPRR